jgi:hypothetical protein
MEEKNIWVLPTKNPSRLWINDITGKIELSHSSDVLGALNIYITSSEKPKEGDYAIHKVFGIGKIINIDGEDCFVTLKTNPTDGSVTTPWKRNIPDIQKIIITSEEELIANGVQRIEEDFLQWFVKNQSCEWVEVKKGFADGSAYGYDFLSYKIIIPQEEPEEIIYYCEQGDPYCQSPKCRCNTIKPKEEPKQDRTCNNNCSVVCGECQIFESKQETLEEAAEKYASYTHINGEKVEIGKYFDEIKKSHFIAGAQWQQEQDKNKYSEEELKHIPYQGNVWEPSNDETLEFEAKRFLISELNMSQTQIETLYSGYVDAVVKFHKWQAERMYSEEDLRNAYRWGTLVNQGTKEHFNEWFEQHKKK